MRLEWGTKVSLAMQSNLPLLVFLVFGFLAGVEEGSGARGDSDRDQHYYTCYQQTGNQLGRSYCRGKYCVKLVHQQTNTIKRHCMNVTESEPTHRVGGPCEVDKASGLPGQTELVCYCRGDYCNAAPRPMGISTTVVITMVVMMMALALAPLALGAMSLPAATWT